MPKFCEVSKQTLSTVRLAQWTTISTILYMFILVRYVQVILKFGGKLDFLTSAEPKRFARFS